MEPLRITFRFSRPVVISDHALHLDALLAWAQADRAMEENAPDPWRTDNLPLSRERSVWQASMLIFSPRGDMETMPMVKRHNLHDIAMDRDIYFKTRKNQILGGSGLYRAFDMRYYPQWMDRAEAWCLGEKKEIKRLLARLSAIGKYTKNGLGRISSLTVYRDEKASSLWRLRHLPAAEFKERPAGYALAMRTAQPPYWDKCSIVPCWVPVVPANLL